MIPIEMFRMIVDALQIAGWAEQDIRWAEGLGPPRDAEAFASETIYVICNSGMKFTVARGIYDRVMTRLHAGESAARGFGHKGKCAAIDKIWRDRIDIFMRYGEAGDKLALLADLPWIGGVTKYHLGKNFGLDVVKPDVHLQRLADLHKVTPHALCSALAAATGYRIGTIDTLLWRACATGILCSRTGRLG